MTHQPAATRPPRWVAIASLVAGLAGLLLMVVFFATAAGATILTIGVVCGAVGVILGIIALRARRPNGAAIVGIVTGAIGFLLGLAIFIFALMFVGAFSA